MKTLITSALIILSSLTLSACTAKDQLKMKVLNKIEQKVIEEKAEVTDDQLLKDIQKDDSLNIDAQFNQLDQELK